MMAGKRRARKKSSYAYAKRRRRRFTAIVIPLVIAAMLVVLLFMERETIEQTAFPLEYKDYVEAAAQKYDIDEALIFAVIRTESNFDPNAVSNAGAMGLMQITRDTYFFVNEKDSRGDLPLELLYDPEVNIDTGAYFLSWLSNDFGNTETAIAAYNAGRSNVNKWLRDPRYSDDGVTLKEIPFGETKNYVKKVMGTYETYIKFYYS